MSLEVVSTISGTVGKQLIRLSELRKHSTPKASKTFFYAGLIINTVCGPAIDMAAYSFAPQSLIAPFGGLDVVWNALSAPYLLQERLTPRRVLGCVLICVGTATAGAMGSHDDRVYTVEYLEDLLFSPRIPIYFAAFFLWFLMNIFCLQNRPKGNPVRGISLGMTAGSIAGNMFCVKAAVEIIQYSIHEGTGEPWKHGITYVMLLGAAFFAISNVKYMTQGLQEFEALFMVTVYEGSMIVSGCISGSIVLLDQKGLEAWRIGLYWLSVLVIVGGMTVVFSNEMQNKSSLAAGTASIEPVTMKELQSKAHIALNVAGVGSAGMYHEGCNSPIQTSPRSGIEPGSPLALTISSPATKNVNSHSPFFDDSPGRRGDGEGDSNGMQATPLGRGAEADDPNTPLSNARV